MKRLLLLLCIILLIHVQFGEMLFRAGVTLNIFHNLPHRGLGMEYAAMTMFPHRSDFAETYLADYLQCATGKHKTLMEGQDRPVVLLLARDLCIAFPNHDNLQHLTTRIKNATAKN